MHHENYERMSKERVTTERWNHFTDVIQKAQLSIEPEQNPDIYEAAKRQGVNEDEIIECYRLLSKIFVAVHKDVFPNQNRE